MAIPTHPAVITALVKDEGGAGAVEYARIAALISMAVVAGAIVFGVNLGDLYVRLGGFFESAGSSVPAGPFGP